MIDMLSADRLPLHEMAGYETKNDFLRSFLVTSGPSIWETSVRPAMELTQFGFRAVITGGASVGTAFFLHSVNVLNEYFEHLRMHAS